jgi:hypothetical protein
MASTSCAASHCASATVVADDHTCAPTRRTRSSRGAGGNPKWKLTTSDRSVSITSAASSPNGSRPGPSGKGLGLEDVAGTAAPPRDGAGAEDDGRRRTEDVIVASDRRHAIS